MLREGMLVKVRDNNAQSFLYRPIVGKIGTIVQVMDVSVRITAPLLGMWLIHKEDAIPYVVQYNKEACQMLQKEEELYPSEQVVIPYDFDVPF